MKEEPSDKSLHNQHLQMYQINLGSITVESKDEVCMYWVQKIMMERNVMDRNG